MKVEIVQGPDGISSRKFSGDIPEGRCGHTINYINEYNIAIVHGGANIELPGKHETRDNSFYILNLATLVWKKVAFAEVPARAFHTATPLVYYVTPAVVYIGGFSKFNDQVSRYSLSEMFILQVFSDVHFQMKKIVIPVILPKV